MSKSIATSCVLSAAGLATLMLVSAAPAIEKKVGAAATTRTGIATGGKSTVGGIRDTVVKPGSTVAELTSWDCRAVGGTVVVVADDRCGASRRYCRMPDTNAVCIEEAAQ